MTNAIRHIRRQRNRIYYKAKKKAKKKKLIVTTDGTNIVAYKIGLLEV